MTRSTTPRHRRIEPSPPDDHRRPDVARERPPQDVKRLRRCVAWAMFGMLVFPSFVSAEDDDPPEIVRFATWNVSLNRQTAGELADELQGGEQPQARKIAEIVQTVRPDVLLLNEFDYDEPGRAADSFRTEYLQTGQNGRSPIVYPFMYVAPVNTGIPSGLDLDGDRRTDGQRDAYGFGRFPGQYGMLLLSRFPIRSESVRTFQTFLWKDMPGARLPAWPDSGNPYYSPKALAVFRLSSKNHWDVPLSIGKQTIHVLAAHPTPPVFDGPEDRNGCRNHDEIRLWADYIDPIRSTYLYDDNGKHGGLTKGAKFVILGNYNADPFDGETVEGAIVQLLKHPLVNNDLAPSSRGGEEASKLSMGSNRRQRGPARHDTADFNSEDGPGNLRVDYVLPSRTLSAYRAAVYWPAKNEEHANLLDVSDHRLVWVDVKVTP